MSVKNISSAILGVGVDDTTIDLFESQYPVPTGVSYNSYVIRDEKTAILDTVDARATDEWINSNILLSSKFTFFNLQGQEFRKKYGA